MVTQPLFLARHAFVCQADNHFVFLDLRKDKYSCLGRDQSRAMQDLLTERDGVIDYIDKSTAAGPGETRIVQGLVDQGLLVHDKKSGKTAVPEKAEAPSDTLQLSECLRPAACRALEISHFVAAVVSASMRLRWGSMEGTVRGVERRKLACTNRSAVAGDRRMAELVAVFRALRPYYPREYLCLFDSLALVKFLAQYGICPQWVFGVKLEPFSAHCWVQEGGLVLNDTVDRVRQYTAIMVI